MTRAGARGSTGAENLAPGIDVSSPEPNRRRALIALLLLAPVPSLGVLAAMVAFPGPVGKGLFFAAKVWLITFPAAWYVLVEKGSPSWSSPESGGLAVGGASGIMLAGVIVTGAWLAGVQSMELDPLRDEVRKMGLNSVLPFLAGAAGWTFINSLLEEYVYRWFVFRQCEGLIPGTAAVAASAAIFTAHHIIAVSRYLDPVLTVLASAGVFTGGVVWSWLYLRYRSIWPCWISHVLADIAVFGIGWKLLFG